MDADQSVSDVADNLLRMMESTLINNPYVNVVRGYVGSALWVNSMPIGALCATTDQPREWTQAEIEHIKTQAAEVSSILQDALERYL